MYYSVSNNEPHYTVWPVCISVSFKVSARVDFILQLSRPLTYMLQEPSSAADRSFHIVSHNQSGIGLKWWAGFTRLAFTCIALSGSRLLGKCLTGKLIEETLRTVHRRM